MSDKLIDLSNVATQNLLKSGGFCLWEGEVKEPEKKPKGRPKASRV